MPQPAHNLTTSPELLRRRQEQQAAAQALTRNLTNCRTFLEAKSLYDAHGEQFNGINFSALFTTLARLATSAQQAGGRAHAAPSAPATPSTVYTSDATGSPRRLRNVAAATDPYPTGDTLPAGPPAPAPSALHCRQQPSSASTVARSSESQLPPLPLLSRPTSRQPRPTPLEGLDAELAGCSRARRAGLSRKERTELRAFVSQRLLPHVGLKLMGLGSRQLATVLAALAQLDCPPPGFWLSEWLQHFARRLDMPPPSPPRLRMAVMHAGSRQVTAGGGDGGVGNGGDVAAGRRASELSAGSAAGPVGGAAAVAAPEPCGVKALLTVEEPAGRWGPGDIGRAVWALAQLKLRRRSPPPAGYGTLDNDFRLAETGATAPAADDGLVEAGVDGPSLVWLETVSRAFSAQVASASPADVASYLWGTARLGYRPPDAVMAALMNRCEQWMGAHPGSRVSDPGGGDGAAGAAAAAGSCAAATSAGSVSHMGPRELCTVLWALALLGFSPGKAWLQRAATELESMGGSVPTQGTLGAMERRSEGAAAPASEVPAAVTGGGGCVRTEDHASAGSCTAPLTNDPVYDESDWWSSHLSAGGGGSVDGRDIAAAAVAGRASSCGGGERLLDARQAATCAWAFARLGYRPPERVLTALLRCASAPLAAAPAPQDLSMSSFALGVLRFRPAPEQAMALLRGMAGQLRNATAQDLVVWAAALARMRLAVPDPWFGAYLRRAALEVEALPPLALVNWVDAVARLRTARPPRRSRLELAMALEAAQLSDRRDVRVSVGAGAKRFGTAAAAATPAMPTDGSEINDGLSDDPWVVVALPKAKRPRAAAAAAAAGAAGAAAMRQGRNLRQHRLRRLCTPPFRRRQSGQAAATPRAAPPALSVVAAAGADNVAAAAAAAPRPPQPTPPATAPPSPVSAQRPPVFIRPAAWHLRRARWLPRLLRLSASRLAQLDLEQHCRLAWAVAHLHTKVKRSWVEQLLVHTGEALEQRLRLQQRTVQQQQQRLQRQQELQLHDAAAAVAAAAAEELAGTGAAGAAAPPPLTAQRVPVVVDARWVLKLARAVELMIRGPRRGGSYKLELMQRRQRRRLQRGHRGDQEALAPSAPYAGARGLSPPPPPPSSSSPSSQVLRRAAPPTRGSPYGYVPRRWRLLLMMAVLPQLPSLSNGQLLRFVRTMEKLRIVRAAEGGGAGGAGRAGARGGYAGDTAGGGWEAVTVKAAEATAAEAESEAGAGYAGVVARRDFGGAWVRDAGTQQRLAAELGGYCRRRVAATCGAEEGCDLTTWEILRWTSGWEEEDERRK